MQYYTPKMDTQREKTVENKMETVGIEGCKELNLSYYIAETSLNIHVYIHIPMMVT